MISAITLKNYRSFSESSFEFSDGVTIIIGPNASGKTNLLEAVHLLAEGVGFRSSDKDLIQHGKEWARIDGYVGDQKRVIKLERQEPRTKKTIEINDTVKARLSFDQTIPIVLFEPDDSRIVGGSPERRRKYLDTLLCSISPIYKRSFAGYKRALKQRNVLLKKVRTPDELFAWNTVLARHATEITNERRQLLDTINSGISDTYSRLADKSSEITIEYTSQIHKDSFLQQYMAKLDKNFYIDKERGFTSIGPHRDDIDIQLNTTSAGTFASRGEGRTITLALKIIEQNIIETVRGIKPILLFDDVFSELDGARRRMLTANIHNHQAIITTTDADVVDKKFASLAQLISL